MDFAHKFITEERLPSQRKDVNACIEKDCTFPALLYCFSMIDLLEALYTGYASAASHTSDNFKEYAVHFMKNSRANFTSEQDAAKLFDEAIKIANTAKESYDRSQALSSIAQSLAKSNKLDDAIKVANTIEIGYRRSQALSYWYFHIITYFVTQWSMFFAGRK
jgi:hypothetical protein